ncbi:hypothetical protein BSEG_04631, partial [Phocaeicola dorei 5_1_36/D4]
GHHPHPSVLFAHPVPGHGFLYLIHQLPAVRHNPYPAAGTTQEFPHYGGQQMRLSRTGGHLHHHIPMKLPLLKEAELHLLLVITKSVVWVIHKRMPATTGNNPPMGR